ncbi:DUF2917 domain-containing protein [Trinickia fusca]|uniref:DUF2917 domain-containing protein n=1 Tax=Trinickia fusca TaxID=2419777 RepID=A0A494XLI7_9BURK|nr:DUF2917 domain-containing protein [Trinickia fusca]RKP48999.1 DUF2917 domain-containing protein [Trinickia fusca]
MREIRIFEMEQDEPATVWSIARPLVVTVTAGQLWLTLEGDAEDYWLDTGQSFRLPAGARAWVGAGRGDVRMTAASIGSRAQPGVARRVLGLMPRRALA